MSAKTTIIMPAYNVGSYIVEAVNSVLAQTRGDWRLVIVDDGSTDNTVEVAKSYPDDRITVVQQDNAGAGAARNRAAAEADTTFLSMLDADDAWAPDYLENMLGALEASPDLAFVSCDALAFIDDRNDAVLCSENVRMTPPVTLERVAAREFQVYTAVSMRRDWFERVGGFDETLRNAQDFDLWLRMLSAGARAEFIAKPLAWYRDRPGSLSDNDVRLSEYTIRVYEKLRAARSDTAALCDGRIEKLRYTIALDSAKIALREGQFAAFHIHAEEALRRGRNPKLRATKSLARVAPPLARLLMAARG